MVSSPPSLQKNRRFGDAILAKHHRQGCLHHIGFATTAGQRLVKRTMKISLAISFAFLSATSTIARADAVSEMAGFSVFGTTDLAELARSGSKTMHGPPMGGSFLSVQSCYVMPGSPAQHVEALRRWNPTRHSELKVFLHGDLPGSPSADNFSRLKNAPNNGPVQSFVSLTEKGGSQLHTSTAQTTKP